MQENQQKDQTSKALDGISVVIATKGRVPLLEDLLKSLQEARSNFPLPSEVILVDDSSEDDVAKIEKLCRTYDARRIYFSPSVAEKRNVGARDAKYELVLFLDSDCIATPNLLKEHYALYTDPSIGGGAGALEFVGEDTWFWKSVEKSPFVICFSFPKWLDEVPWTPTANFSVRKDVFLQVNGFDRDFPDKPGGEDVDLGLRIVGAGYHIRCTKAGLVYHSKKTWTPVKAMFRRLWHYGCANYYLVWKHPDYVMKILPRQTFLYAFGFLAIAAGALLRGSAWLLLLLPIWLLVDLCLRSIFVNAFASYKRTSFLHQFVVQLLELDNELGYVWTCLKKGRPSYINENIVYFDGQMDGVLDNGAIFTWCELVSFAALYAALMLL